MYERYERVKRRGLHKGKTPKTFKIKKHHQMQTLKIKAGTDKGQPSKKKKKKKKKKEERLFVFAEARDPRKFRHSLFFLFFNSQTKHNNH